MTEKHPCFIAVHVGAGHLSYKKENKYRAACANACERAMTYLKQGATAVDAVTLAIIELEDHPITNAGYGSNLTFKGKVECDASLMDGQSSHFGGVGAVSGVKNPIKLCQRMVQENKKGLMSLGRVPPIFLCGSGAKEWAQLHHVDTVPEDSLIEEQAFNTYMTHMQMVHDNMKQGSSSSDADFGHDTVGAICVDEFGNIASGVSSGGISLKSPGRIGEAAMYGSGCWAQNQNGTNTAGLACSVSGTGEQIMRSRFTNKCMDRLLIEDDMHHALSSALKKDFLDSPFLTMYDDKSVGLIALRLSKKIEFWYGHVTESMGIGYMSSTSNKSKTFISRKPNNEAFVISGSLVN
ncbi:threonine aspartase 1-like protein, partial [Halteromyces radiatus]|uniref:threonine aspartase 1-like protein n=1 Tax=Halteromyces radiatus TaxID=101107 RepID=UPI00221FECA9